MPSDPYLDSELARWLTTTAAENLTGDQLAFQLERLRALKRPRMELSLDVLCADYADQVALAERLTREGRFVTMLAVQALRPEDR